MRWSSRPLRRWRRTRSDKCGNGPASLRHLATSTGALRAGPSGADGIAEPQHRNAVLKKLPPQDLGHLQLHGVRKASKPHRLLRLRQPPRFWCPGAREAGRGAIAHVSVNNKYQCRFGPQEEIDSLKEALAILNR